MLVMATNWEPLKCLLTLESMCNSATHTAEYYTAVKMDGLQPHVEIYTILIDIVLSHKASPKTYYCVGVHTHEGEGMASTKFRRVTAFGGNQENDAYIGGYVLVLGAGGGFGEVIVHEWSLNE